MKGVESSGFTLLEVIISLTITAVIVVMLFGAMRVGVRAWEKGEQDLDVRLRDRVVLDLMKRQLSSLVITEQKDEEKNPFLLVKGDSSSLRALSYMAIMPANEFGAVFVRYRAAEEGDEKRLNFFERNLVFLDQDADPEKEGTGEEEGLLQGLSEISFAYLKETDEGGEKWLDSWDPEEEGGFPAAFRISLRRGDSALSAVARVEGRPQGGNKEGALKEERKVERPVSAKGTTKGATTTRKRTSLKTR
jgi:general secretion pathway protein J